MFNMGIADMINVCGQAIWCFVLMLRLQLYFSVRFVYTAGRLVQNRKCI